MDAVQPILPFLGWITLALVGLVGMAGLWLMRNFLDDIREMNKKVITHESKLEVHENRLDNLEVAVKEAK